jgi:hypothetical protein
MREQEPIEHDPNFDRHPVRFRKHPTKPRKEKRRRERPDRDPLSQHEDRDEGR